MSDASYPTGIGKWIFCLRPTEGVTDVAEAVRRVVAVRHRPRLTKPGRAPWVPLWVAFLFMGAVWLSSSPGLGLVQAQEPAPTQAGGAYRRPLANDPSTLDPARMRDIYSLAVGQQLFDGLVQFDQTLSITPALAQFWTATRDGLTWTGRESSSTTDGRSPRTTSSIPSLDWWTLERARGVPISSPPFWVSRNFEKDALARSPALPQSTDTRSVSP